MKTFILFFGLAMIAATVATYARYQSFSPCDWMEQEYAQETGLPRVLARGRVQGELLLRGVRSPDPVDCLMAWWQFRIEDLPEKK